MFMEQVFTVVQVLDLFGVLQCVTILALVFLKATDIRKEIPTVAFFAALGLSFGLPATLHPQFAFGEVVTIWLAQAWIPTLSYLLILQAAIGRLPEARHFAVLALPIIGAPAVLVLVSGSEGCGGVMLCAETVTLLRVFCVLLGAFILLLIWLHLGLLTPLREDKKPRNRYWVVLTLIVFNILNLWIDIPRAAEVFEPTQAAFARTVFGLTFVYLVTTLMFRITSKRLVTLPGLAILRRSIELTTEELALVDKVRDLMTLDKLYQEPSVSCADLAHELYVSEKVLSRVINSAFARSIPKLLNDHRVDEAKLLLRDSDIQLMQIVSHVGFSSRNAFNRVFKDTTGQAPTEYRASVTTGSAG